MRRNPERLAWLVLWVAIVVFCLLITGIPLAVRSYLLNSSRDQTTLLQRIEGTILVQEANSSKPYGVTDAAELQSGAEVILDATARGTLDLFERSHVTLYSNTSISLERVQSPRFEISDRPNRIVLNLTAGLARVGVPFPGDRETDFQVLTPHTSIWLQEGSYRIEVTNESTQITVVRGEARVGGPATEVLLSEGLRTQVDLTGVTASALPAAENLIEDGNFQHPLPTSWLTSTMVLTSSVAPPSIELFDDGGRSAVRFLQEQAQDGDHTEGAIQQKLDRDVRDFDRLQVALDVKLNFQSLSGGGLLSSEFPIIVRLDYKDLWGNNQFWTYGFYYRNPASYPIATAAWGGPAGEQILQGVWYPYESENLIELLAENRPAQITALTVYASGWNYDSEVSEVQLIVE